MHIQNSALDLQARHSRHVTERSQEWLEMWSGPRSATTGRPVATKSATNEAPGSVDRTRKPRDQDERLLPPQLQTLARMIEAITGRPVQLLDDESLQTNASTPKVSGPSGIGAAASTPTRQGWGMVYEATQTRVETESLRVRAQGEIRTADGRSIAFELNLEMESVQIDTRQTSLRAGDAMLKDPLVLHFEGPVGALRDTRFAFDLDADGQTDRMPFVGSGSGFLVLDRNGNGVVDNGTELFGARTGDGFAELAAFDDDGNGWIDEADAVFQQLQVWRMDAQGTTQLTALADNNVGALALARVNTHQRLRAEPTGATLGQLRSTGFYLTETGQTQALQQIDLVV